MHTIEFIEAKKLGKTHSANDIKKWIELINNNSLANHQLSAWLMAVYFRGLNQNELYYLTKEMVKSGESIDLSSIDEVVVDKHSTGGVGDTTTLITGPIVASLDLPFAKMSGKGLGFTGGTLDKLLAIPNFRINLNKAEFIEQLKDINIVITGQTASLVPADGKIYNIRDVTATVDSIPLIASSIMSKKLATGADKILIDVKLGDGAFMKEIKLAEELAKTMARIGSSFKKETVCLITNMDEPLGDFIGNGLEVYEAIEILKGIRKGPLYHVSIFLAGYELLLANKVKNLTEAIKIAKKQISNNQAFEKFKEMVKKQNGDISYIENPEKFKKRALAFEIRAEKSGYIKHIKAQKIGKAALALGCGRYNIEDELDYYAGIERLLRKGDKVKKGDTIFKIYSDNDKYIEAKNIIEEAIEISDEKEDFQLLYSLVTDDSIEKINYDF